MLVGAGQAAAQDAAQDGRGVCYTHVIYLLEIYATSNLNRSIVTCQQLFPFLPDGLACRVAAWTCFLLRRLQLPQQELGRSQRAATDLISPAHLSALLDSSAQWFGEWALRLPPGQLAYLLRRTGLLRDLIQRCRQGASPVMPSNDDEGASEPPSIVSPDALAQRLRAASLSMLTHALRAWHPAACIAVLLACPPAERPLWHGALQVDPRQLPSAPADPIVGAALPTNPTVLSLGLQGAAEEAQEDGPGVKGEEVCGAVLGLFIDALLFGPAAPASAKAAAQGLLHVAAGLGGSDSRVLVS